MLTRRHLLRAAPALILAPAIVRVTSIMPVKAMPRRMPPVEWQRAFNVAFQEIASKSYTDLLIYGRATFDPDDVWRRMAAHVQPA